MAPCALKVGSRVVHMDPLSVDLAKLSPHSVPLTINMVPLAINLAPL